MGHCLLQLWRSNNFNIHSAGSCATFWKLPRQISEHAVVQELVHLHEHHHTPAF